MRKYFAAPRTFFSLMVSFMSLGVGNVINDAIGNHISLEAIGIIGAYYTVEMLVIAIWSLGFKTYVVKRANERGLFSVQVVCGLICGLAMFFGAESIAGLFGISDEMRRVLANMFRLGVVVPWLAVMVCSPEVGVFVMASTGFFQTTGRALWYYHKVRQLDRQFGWETEMAPADMDACIAKGE